MKRKPSPALVISIIALFVALGGTSYAAVKLNGKNITGLAPRQVRRDGVSRSFQIPQLFTSLTLEQNLLMALAILRDVTAAVEAAHRRHLVHRDLVLLHRRRAGHLLNRLLDAVAISRDLLRARL